jgi:hypothetical protein
MLFEIARNFADVDVVSTRATKTLPIDLKVDPARQRENYRFNAQKRSRAFCRCGRSQSILLWSRDG